MRIIGGDTKVKVRVSILNATATFDVDPDDPLLPLGTATGTLILTVPAFALDDGRLDPAVAGAASVKVNGPLVLVKIFAGNFAVAVPLVTPAGKLLPPLVAGGATVTLIGTTPVVVPTKGGGGGDVVVAGADGVIAEDAAEDDPVPAALVAVTVNV